MKSIFVEELISGLKEEKFDEQTISAVVAEINRDEQSFNYFMYMYEDLCWTPKEIAEFFMGLSTFVAGNKNVSNSAKNVEQKIKQPQPQR